MAAWTPCRSPRKSVATGALFGGAQHSVSESEVAQSCPTLCDQWTVAHQAPPSMGFSRQEYWSGLPFPSPGHLPDPGIKPRSPTLQADALTSAPPGKPIFKKRRAQLDQRGKEWKRDLQKGRSDKAVS